MRVIKLPMVHLVIQRMLSDFGMILNDSTQIQQGFLVQSDISLGGMLNSPIRHGDFHDIQRYTELWGFSLL